MKVWASLQQVSRNIYHNPRSRKASIPCSKSSYPAILTVAPNLSCQLPVRASLYVADHNGISRGCSSHKGPPRTGHALRSMNVCQYAASYHFLIQSTFEPSPRAHRWPERPVSDESAKDHPDRPLRPSKTCKSHQRHCRMNARNRCQCEVVPILKQSVMSVRAGGRYTRQTSQHMLRSSESSQWHCSQLFHAKGSHESDEHLKKKIYEDRHLNWELDSRKILASDRAWLHCPREGMHWYNVERNRAKAQRKNYGASHDDH